jgi:hypothetical protein
VSHFLYGQRYGLGAVALSVFVVLAWQAVSALTGWNANSLIAGSTIYLAAYAFLKAKYPE